MPFLGEQLFFKLYCIHITAHCISDKKKIKGLWAIWGNRFLIKTHMRGALLRPTITKSAGRSTGRLPSINHLDCQPKELLWPLTLPVPPRRVVARAAAVWRGGRSTRRETLPAPGACGETRGAACAVCTRTRPSVQPRGTPRARCSRPECPGTSLTAASPGPSPQPVSTSDVTTKAISDLIEISSNRKKTSNQ